MSREGALWIGGLETYMDEEFLMKCLNTMGEHSILSIKVIKNKFTGGAAGYGFINFVSDQVTHHRRTMWTLRKFYGPRIEIF